MECHFKRLSSALAFGAEEPPAAATTIAEDAPPSGKGRAFSGGANIGAQGRFRGGRTRHPRRQPWTRRNRRKRAIVRGTGGGKRSSAEEAKPILLWRQASLRGYVRGSVMEAPARERGERRGRPSECAAKQRGRQLGKQGARNDGKRPARRRQGAVRAQVPRLNSDGQGSG